ncbi:MAG: hypothetical protein UZ17_ACD001001811 [Acidobacteria bacterium OLB17]|nr:MAG: hypothetical protein UZ17_ACD001001811 [Acidobacteria bacterium OLB17]MCZ2390614.1 hypothetical protein [Acidobacteriota bacterium]
MLKPRFLPALLLPLALFASQAYATTWFPKEFVCPIDNQKNTFMVVGSYGSYIYSWPSKYQWLFWPKTDSPTFYFCKKCHLATYMWDYEKLPKEKIEAIKMVLEGIKYTNQFTDYLKTPVNDRLDVMEKVYSVLDKDDDWWCEFYRVRGYHYDRAGDKEKAAEYRKKALGLAAKLMKDGRSATPKKELLYIAGAMKHFIGDDSGAIAELETALKTKFESSKLKPEELENAEKNMNERITDYIAKIRSEKDKPRLLFDSENSD